MKRLNLKKLLLFSIVLFPALFYSNSFALTIDFQEGNRNIFSKTEATFLSYDSAFLSYVPPYDGINGSFGYLVADGNQSYGRILIKYPDIFGDSDGQIPYGSIINSAILKLRVGGFNDDAISSSRLYVYRVLADWSEEAVTWENFGSSPGGVSGIDYSTTDYSSFTLGSIGSLASVNLTNSLNLFSSQAASNYGWIIRNYTTDGAQFRSEDYYSQLYRPILSVNYTEPSVPEPLTIILLLSCLIGNTLNKAFYSKKS